MDNEGNTPLHRAAESDREDIGGILLDRGVEVEALDWQGNTPLHVAAACNSVRVAALLLKYGANVTGLNSEGRSPLDIAYKARNIEVVELIEQTLRGWIVLSFKRRTWLALFVTSESRGKLRQVNFCRDFWSCYSLLLGIGEKNRPMAEEPFPSNNPRTNCGGHFCSSFPLEGGFELFIVIIFFYFQSHTERASLMHVT